MSESLSVWRRRVSYNHFFPWMVLRHHPKSSERWGREFILTVSSTDSGDTPTLLTKSEIPSTSRLLCSWRFLCRGQLLFFRHWRKVRCFLPTPCHGEATHVQSFLVPWECVQWWGQLAQGAMGMSHSQDSSSRRAKYWLQGSHRALEGAIMIESNDCHLIRWLAFLFPVLLAIQTAAQAHGGQAAQEQQRADYHQQPYIPEMYPICGQTMFRADTVLLTSCQRKLDETQQDQGWCVKDAHSHRDSCIAGITRQVSPTFSPCPVPFTHLEDFKRETFLSNTVFAFSHYLFYLLELLFFRGLCPFILTSLSTFLNFFVCFSFILLPFAFFPSLLLRILPLHLSFSPTGPKRKTRQRTHGSLDLSIF